MNQNAFNQYTTQDWIDNLINMKFMADWGIVAEVPDETHVKVKHAVRTVMIDGTACEDTVSLCELLTPNGTEFSLQVPPQVGDTVLLVGLRNLLGEVDVSDAVTPTQFAHYEQCTMKAILLCSYGDKGKVKVQTDNGKLDVTAQDEVTCTGTKVSLVASAAGSVNLIAEINEALSDIQSAVTDSTLQAALSAVVTGDYGVTAALALKALQPVLVTLGTQLATITNLISEGTD